MATLQETQNLAAFRPRIWRALTKDQRRQVVAKFDETHDYKKAFAQMRAYRVTLSDLTFDSVGAMRVGGGR